LKRQRLAGLLALLVVELLILVFVGTRLVRVESVEDRREIVGTTETIYFRSEIVGDPPLMVLLGLALILPLASRRLRREPILLVALQAVLVGLIMFVLWPLAQVFIEGFRAGQGAEGFSLVQFEKLLQTPMVARATKNTMVIGLISATLVTAVGLVVAYTLTLANVPWKRWLRILVILTLVSPPFAVSFAFILLFGRRGVITYDLLGSPSTTYTARMVSCWSSLSAAFPWPR
jgi:ABC-type glycerol-3-phosphate transport system permease component